MGHRKVSSRAARISPDNQLASHGVFVYVPAMRTTASRIQSTSNKEDRSKSGQELLHRSEATAQSIPGAAADIRAAGPTMVIETANPKGSGTGSTVPE